MKPFGPIYCETPELLAGGFPFEPWNTFSNVAILFGLWALYVVHRRAPRTWDLYALAALLVMNGVGSFLWHGTRERWALSLDVNPALVFLVGLIFVWAWRVSPLWQSALLVALLLVASYALRAFGLGFGGWWGTVAPAVVAAAVWLMWRTWEHSRRATLLGSLAMGSALVALGFRALDRAACDTIAFGTHFLWHIALSCAAFLCLLALVALVEAKKR